MEVEVEYDYTAEQADELTIKKGDILTNVVQKMDGWWEGSLGSKRGLFPDNFVKVIPPAAKADKDDDVFDEPVQLRKKPAARRLKALFSYAPEQDDELTLEVGDIIEFLAEVEDGWWKGYLKGKTGIFPSNFVTELETPSVNGTGHGPESNRKAEGKPVEKARDSRDSSVKAIPDVVPHERASVDEEPAPKLPPKPVRELARCFYPYSAQNDDELELQEGDIVTIISKNCEDEGWWRGELRGKIGLFPDNFVKLISPSEMPATNSTSSLPLQQKITAQGDTENPLKEVPPGGDSSVTDGAVSSKKTLEKEISGSKKPLKGERGALPQKPLTPPSPMSSPSGGVGFLTNALGLKGLKRESKPKEEQTPTADVSESEVGEFNAIERNEKQLNHLTATRAKPPNRRPPSTLLPRETEHSTENGTNAQDSLESPHNHSVTSNGGISPLGNSFNSSAGRMDSTASTALISDSSGISSTPGSRFSYSREQDSSSTSGLNAVGSTTPTSINPLPAKPKQMLPWMDELKKRQATSPVAPSTSSPPTTASGSSNSNSNPPANTTLSHQSSTTSPSFSGIAALRSKDRDSGGTHPITSAKAPPLPAKPVLPAEKTPLSSTISSGTNSTTTSTLAMRLCRKTPSTTSVINSVGNNYVNTYVSSTATNAATANNVNNNTSPNVNVNNSYVNANATADGLSNTTAIKGGGSNPPYVSYEEHARLKDRVFFLESELEAVKKQLKLLLDREVNKGHIV